MKNTILGLVQNSQVRRSAAEYSSDLPAKAIHRCRSAFFTDPMSRGGTRKNEFSQDAVMRRAREQDLFEDHAPYRYHAIASNRPDEDAQTAMEWYSRRGDDSENRIKDLKISFGMEYMPCGSFQANAVFFSIGALTYNLYLGFHSHALGSGWKCSQVQTVRWRLFETAGKIVRLGRQMFLKISAAMGTHFSDFAPLSELAPLAC